jgi:hypothetical protein
LAKFIRVGLLRKESSSGRALLLDLLAEGFYFFRTDGWVGNLETVVIG